jgi:mycofactocin precursor
MSDPVPETRDPSPPAAHAGADSEVDGATGDQPLVETDLLVEDVSIDGMCGVY